jgi:hypothetical protein
MEVKQGLKIEVDIPDPIAKFLNEIGIGPRAYLVARLFVIAAESLLSMV